jgi:YVTN family beta-propeller protein
MKSITRILVLSIIILLLGSVTQCTNDGSVGPDELESVGILQSNAAPRNAHWLSDYFPLNPHQFGIRTYYWYDEEERFVAFISGTETVPYLSGSIEATKLFIEDEEIGLYVDGRELWLGVTTDDYYVSVDCALTAFPFPVGGKVWDGMFIDLIGLPAFFVNKDDPSDCSPMPENDRLTLFKIDDVDIFGQKYANALILWSLEPEEYQPLDFGGFEDEWGITLPTSAETRGNAVDGFAIFAFRNGLVGLGETSVDDGELDDLALLVSRAPGGEYAYVGHFAPFVSVVDVQTMTQVAQIPVAASSAPNIAIAPNGQFAYVVERGPAGLSKVDLSTNSVVENVALIPGSGPLDVALTPSGHRIFVTNFAGHFVTAVDANTLTVLATIPLTDADDFVNGIAMGPGGRQVFVSSQGSGRIHVIDTQSLELVATIETGMPGVGELALTQNGRFVLGTSANAATVVVIDTRQLAMTATIPVADGPNGVAIPSNGKEAYVVHAASDLVTVIDTRTLSVVATIDVPGGPRRIGVSTNGHLAMVTNNFSGEATLIDVVNRTVLATEFIGGQPWGVTFLNGPQRN